MKVLYQKGFFKLILAWYDMWVGLYWDVGHQTLYICPLPMVVLRFQFPGKRDEAKHRLDRVSERTCPEVTALLEKIQLRDDALGGVMDNDLYNEITGMLQRIKTGRVKIIQ